MRSGWIGFIITLLGLVFSAQIFAKSFPVPEGTQFMLYVKDMKTLEDTARKTGMLSLSADSTGMIIDYLKEDHPALALLQWLRGLDSGSAVKAMMGEMALVNVNGDTILIFKLDKTAAVFAKILSTVKSTGQYQGFYVFLSGDNLIVSRSQTAMNHFATAGLKTSSDPVLAPELFNDDIVLYMSGEKLLQNRLDALLVKPDAKRSMALSVNLVKRTVIVCARPKLPASSGERTKYGGQLIPATSLFFWDDSRSPADVFQAVIDKKAFGASDKELRSAFDNQTTLAITSLDPNKIYPSFMAVLKPQTGKGPQAEKALKGFISNVMGETSFSTKKTGALTVTSCDDTGMYYCTLFGYYVLSDSLDAIASAQQTYTAKKPSVWDIKEAVKLKELTEKRTAFVLNFSAFADIIFKSIISHQTPDPVQKEDLRSFLRAVKAWGTGVGYGEDRKDYQYYYLSLKESK